MKIFTRILTFALLFVGIALFAQPANDNCSAADVVGALPWTSSAFDVTLATATGDPTAPTCQTNVARSIWFTFTPAATGNYYISSCQSDAAGSTVPDIVLGIYTSTGGCAGPFTQVVCDDDGCTTLNFQSLISSANLTSGTTYYIVAWQYCLSGCSAPTVGAENIQLFVKQNQTPDCATLNTPANGATSIAPNTPLTWTPAGTGGTPTGYKVYLGTVNPPTTLVSTVTAPTTTYTPSGQLPSTTYYWYIVPTNGVGDAVGCNSTIFSYTTAAGPTCPGSLGAGTVTVGSLPYASGAGQTTCGNGNNVTSSNSTVCGSTSYYGGEDKTYIFTPTSTASHTILVTTAADEDAGITLYQGCPFTGSGGTCVGFAQSTTGLTRTIITTLTAGVTYYLVVDNFPAPTCLTSYTVNISLTVPPLCTTNTSPANGATGVVLLPTLTWAAAANTTSYDIYFVGTLPTGWVNPVNTASTSYTILAANTLVANTTYTWYIVPKNAAGSATGCDLSAATTFTTASPATTFSGTGNWSDPARWSAGVPGCSSPVTIAASAVCAIDVAAVAGDVTVAATGTINLAGNSLTLGCASGGGNRIMSVSGTLNVTGGVLTVNGRVSINSGATFNQSSGDIVIDGNSGSAASSVAAGTAMLLISSGLGTVSGGTITIVDPNFNASGKAVDYNVSTTAKTWATAHILNIGDGASSQSSSNTGGFILESYTGTGRLVYGTLNIKGGNTTNRWASLGAWSINVGGTTTVDAGSEIRLGSTSTSPVFIGNIVNNGTITSTVNISLAGISGNSVVVNPSTQTISGGGVWRNLSASPTANLTSLTVNNSSGTPIALPASMISGVGTGSISSTLTLTAGKLDVGGTPFILGISAATNGTLSPATPLPASYIIGEFQRWIGTTSGNRYFPVGTTNTPRFAQINFTGAQTTGGIVSTKFVESTAGTSGLPIPAEAGNGNIIIDLVSPTGHWQIDRLSGGGGTYTAIMDASGFTKVGGSAITDFANVKLVKRASAGSWAAGATGTASVIPNAAGLATATRVGCTDFSVFAIGGTTAALPLELNSFTGKVQDRSNMLNWETAQERDVNTHIVERSADGTTWTEIGRKAGQVQSNVATKYELEDRAPLAKAYYRLRSVDFDGKESVSASIVLTRKSEQFAITNVFPNPTDARVMVQFATKNEAAVMIRIVDLTGRIVLEQQTEVGAGINEIPVNLQSLATGVYNVTITNGTETAGPVRIVKQ